MVHTPDIDHSKNPSCYLMKEITFYLHHTLWVWLAAVIAFKDSPRARGGYVFLEMFPLQYHVTVFVCAGDKFEKTRCQVNLLYKIFTSTISFNLHIRTRQKGRRK